MFRRQRPRHLEEVLRAVTGSPEAPLWALAPWLAGVLLGNLLTDLLPWWLTMGVIGALIGGFWIYFRWYPKGPLHLSVHIEPQQPKRAPGLILPVGPVSWNGAAEEQRSRLRQLRAESLTNPQEPLSTEDQRLLERSNLKPALAAIEYHYGAGNGQTPAEPSVLKDVWAITTEESTGSASPGASSVGVGHLLKRWFLSRHPEAADRVCFHLDSYQGLVLRTEPMDYTGLARLIDQIYQKAPYKDAEIIADITPGTKVMSLAAAMGCLPPKRTMQYMTAPRDPETGDPIQGGELAPLLVDIDPYVEEIS